jgi:threonine synthase
MNFISTRNPDLSVDFQTALLQGLASDGGLFCPEKFPDLTQLFKSFTKSTPFNSISEETLSSLLGDTLSKDTVNTLISRAFFFAPRITQLENNLSILELFHGPSHAFKDFGACFLASAMENFLGNTNKKALILTATSGDTGSAVAQAFYKKNNINVVILYPSGRVSPLQEKQLTTLGENITALEIKGSFDDCQRMVKEAFLDDELTAKLPLSSANSINLGRLIPQSFYYIWGRKQSDNANFVFSVPSGNFGNLTAGIYAKTWGLPVTKFIAATNANDIVPEYLTSGIYAPRSSRLTLSNAMDVGAPSNYERLNHLFNNDVNKFRMNIIGETVSDKETLSAMKEVFTRFNYELCPHTAVGYLSARRHLCKEPDSHVMVLSTAHPAKFLEVVEQAIGKTPIIPENLLVLLSKQKKSTIMDPSSTKLKEYLLYHFI